MLFWLGCSAVWVTGDPYLCTSHIRGWRLQLLVILSYLISLSCYQVVISFVFKTINSGLIRKSWLRIMASYRFVIEGCWAHRAAYIFRNLLIPPLLVLGTVTERVLFYALSVSLPKPRGYSKQADVTPTVAFFTRNTTRAIFLPHTTHPYRHLRHPAPYRHVLCNFSTREVLNSRQISYCQYGLVCVGCGSYWLRMHSASCFYHHVLYSGTTKRNLKREIQKKKKFVGCKRGKEKMWKGRKDPAFVFDGVR